MDETRWWDDNADGIIDPHTSSFAWSYDDLGRLTDEVFTDYEGLLDYSDHFTYDLAGNRTEKTRNWGDVNKADEATGYTFDANDRLKTEALDTTGDGQPERTTTYGYTGTQQTSKDVSENGARTTLTTNTYDLQGRLETVTVEPHENDEPVGRERTTYDYDANGVRVRATKETDGDLDGEYGGVNDSGTETEYLIDSRNPTLYAQILQEVTRDLKTQSVTDQRIYTLGMDVISQASALPGSGSAGSPLILLYDGHGSTRHLTDLNAAIQESYIYDAYGNAVNFDPATALTHLLYSGESFDSRIGQQYLRARWYDPLSGRFNRLDPFAGDLKNPQSLHKYLYTHADPINGVDPSGRVLAGSLAGFGGSLMARTATARAVTQIYMDVIRKVGSFALTSSWILRALEWSRQGKGKGPIPQFFQPDALILSGTFALVTPPVNGTVWNGMTGVLGLGNTGGKLAFSIDAVRFRKLPNRTHWFGSVSAGFGSASSVGIEADLGLQWGVDNPDEYESRGLNVSFGWESARFLGLPTMLNANLVKFGLTGITLTQGTNLPNPSSLGLHLTFFKLGGQWKPPITAWPNWNDFSWSYTFKPWPLDINWDVWGAILGNVQPPPIQLPAGPLADDPLLLYMYAQANKDSLVASLKEQAEGLFS